MAASRAEVEVLAIQPGEREAIRPEGSPWVLLEQPQISPRDRDERTHAPEAQLRSILETAPEVILNVNRQGLISFINRTLPPLRVEEVLGKSCLEYVAEPDRARVLRAIEHVFASATIDEFEVAGPPDPEGAPRWISVRAGPVFEGGRVVAATLCAADVSERRRVEARQRELEDQLRQAQKVESIGRLAGGVAHDFNNLLTSVLGFTELALLDVPKGSEAAAHLECVLEAAERGAALTSQLLAFARKKIVKPEVVDLNAILRKMAPMMRRLVGEDVDLKLALTSGALPAKVDLGSMEQVIMNLVVNARDAVAGRGRIALETRVLELAGEDGARVPELPRGAYVSLDVNDSGCGMSAEVRARVFEPFFTTKAQGEGTGLGLAMCHGLVKQAGGHIEVRSELGVGSSFRIYLPLAGERPSAPRFVANPLSARGRETLLIVEDEEMILRVAQQALRGFGYRVLTARDGQQALELSEHTGELIHLLITDVVMPKMSGQVLAEKLGARRPGLKVLFSSGHTETAIVEQGVLVDGVDFLQKPYSPTALAKRVREILDRN